MNSPNALHSAGSNCLAASAYPAADGWNMSWEKALPAPARTRGPAGRRAEPERHPLPGPPRPARAPAAIRGCAPPSAAAGESRVMTPKSGQVPTTTTAPLARSRRTAAPTRRADGPMPFSFVMSLAPIMITAASGGGPATNMASIWPDKAFRRGADDRLGAQPDPLARTRRPVRARSARRAPLRRSGAVAGRRWSRRTPSDAGRTARRGASARPDPRRASTRRRRVAGCPMTSE